MRSLSLLATLVLGCGSTVGSTAVSAPPERSATLLFFADTHAQLEPHPELFWTRDRTTEIVPAGGYARLAHVIQSVRRETGNRTVVIDGGDTFQGSGPAAWSQGGVVVAPQRALGVDLAVPGNWEVAYGARRMRELFAAVGYEVLATNLVDAATNAPIFPGSTIREVGGIRFGFIGFTDPDVPERQAPAYSAGLRYLDATTIGPAVERVRAHADVVVLVAHVGLARTLALVDAIDGIDLVLSGDTHERTHEPIRRNGALVVEPGAFGSMLGRIDVVLDARGAPQLRWHLLELRADRYPEDPAVARVVHDALAPWHDRAEHVLAYTDVALERYGVVENNVDALLADAIRAAAGTDIALSNGFRFGHPIQPGPIRERDLWTLLPISTRLRVGIVTARQLRDFWESELEHVFATDPRRLFGGWLPRVSGMTVRFRADRPYGQRVTAIEVGGQPLDETRTYSIAACEREGDRDDALCRIRGVARARSLELDVHAAVRDHLAKLGVIRDIDSGRVRALDLPARVYSQFERR